MRRVYLTWFWNRSKPVMFLQLPLVFVFLIYAGIAGDGKVNILPVMTWTVWWAGLIFLVVFLGKAWCFVCPWDFAACKTL